VIPTPPQRSLPLSIAIVSDLLPGRARDPPQLGGHRGGCHELTLTRVFLEAVAIASSAGRRTGVLG